jgi:hypothetical protein
MAGNAKQTCVVIPPIRSFRRPVRARDGIADSRLVPCVDNASLDVLHPWQCLRELRQSRAPQHGRSRGEYDRDAEDARGAGERDDIVAHLVRREISNARNKPGLVVNSTIVGSPELRATVICRTVPPYYVVQDS